MSDWTRLDEANFQTRELVFREERGSVDAAPTVEFS